MGKPIEKAISYVASVAKRTIGMSAWQETLQKPQLLNVESYYNNKWPVWTRVIPGVINDGVASLSATCQFSTPISSRIIGGDLNQALDNPEKSLIGKTPSSRRKGFLLFGSLLGGTLLPLAADVALLVTFSRFSNNYGEFIGLLMARNVVTHVGLDAAEVVGRGAARVFRHFRPPTTVAV